MSQAHPLPTFGAGEPRRWRWLVGSSLEVWLFVRESRVGPLVEAGASDGAPREVGILWALRGGDAVGGGVDISGRRCDRNDGTDSIGRR